MELNIEDIYSLSDFQREAKTHIQKLKKSGRPEILTINGKAELVVQDARAYQKLLELVETISAIKGIERGLESMKLKKGQPAESFFKDFERKVDLTSRLWLSEED